MCRICLGLLLTFGVCGDTAIAAEPTRFEVVLDREIFAENFSGRVYVFFSNKSDQPRRGPDWFHPEPFVSMDVQNWSPGESLRISDADPLVHKFPRNFAELNLDGMFAQAVVRLNPYDRNVGTGVGNGFSEVAVYRGTEPLRLTVSQRVLPPVIPAMQRTRVVSMPSQLLSDFHGRVVNLNASVTLPENYDRDTQRRYPVIYEVPGFGGTHLSTRLLQRHQQQRLNRQGVDFIKVLLDPSCPLGHHVFANSKNNGPYGDALVEELIPEIDRQFRTDAREYGRFVTGHSSGGWSSLWLQVNYPKVFGGTWSTAPDPVDFRDFQKIDLYDERSNMFVDLEQKRRPLARVNGQVMLWYDNFSHMEDVLGYGGQLHSFEAVFSPRGTEGQPQLLWDRKTGEIDPQVAEAWEKYDINLLLQKNWPRLKDDLAGKIHVVMGDADTFYLEGATILLKDTLAKLGSDADVLILPDRDHFNLFADGLAEKIEEEISLQYLEHQTRSTNAP